MLFSFPGAFPDDNILGLLKLMSSKNYKTDLAAKIALDGGYDPCTKFSGNENFWRERAGCEPGFVADKSNGYCYKVLPTLESFNAGEKRCKFDYFAEILLFTTDSEVIGLLDLIQRGKN
jgi:hypothetical protein